MERRQTCIRSALLINIFGLAVFRDGLPLIEHDKIIIAQRTILLGVQMSVNSGEVGRKNVRQIYTLLI